MLTVSEFYREVKPEEDLSQGDIFADFPIPLTEFEPPVYELCEDGERYQEREVQGELTQGMMFMTRIDVKPVILLSQSCDVFSARRLLLAPLRPFPRTKASDLWDKISKMGSHLLSIPRVYLADHPAWDMDRQYIDLESFFTSRREDVERFAKAGKRIGGLSSEGIGHIQFRLSLFLCRFARNDIIWPSLADLELKFQYLNDQVKKGKDKIGSKQDQLSKAKPEEKGELEEELNWLINQQTRNEKDILLIDEAIRKAKK
jgi:hypothetical protein